MRCPSRYLLDSRFSAADGYGPDPDIEHGRRARGAGAMSAGSARRLSDEDRFASLLGEARFGWELAALVADAGLHPPRRQPEAAPVLLIPGFLAGDASLLVLRSWLRLRGHPVSMSGIRVNVDCAERAVTRLQHQLHTLGSRSGSSAVIIGQSRGGILARALAVREPDLVDGLVTLGSPVLDQLAVSEPVLRMVRSVARLAALGVPGTFSQTCADGACCAQFRRDLVASLPAGVSATAIYSRSDGIVDWQACLDPDAQHVEVASSHCGMAVNADVYRVLERVLSADQ
jgi:pimeloyl-ACP methyl ester carboxylesterase